MNISATSTFTPGNLNDFMFGSNGFYGKVLKSVTESGDLVAAKAKDLVAVDTGATRDSIDSVAIQSETKIEAIVAPHTSYSGFLEFGTRKMAAQPFLRPAADSSHDEVMSIFEANGVGRAA
jgi:HK97 gp10 family phage protein